jgi:hypothetical protein
MAAVGCGCRPASALRTAHNGGSGRRPASAASLTMRSSRPGSAASLPGSHACNPGFSLLQPPPAAGIGMFPRTASELAARRARPASAPRPRTCGGGWRLKGGGSSTQSRVARERYFVPPPSRVVTHQEGTTLFFDVPRVRRSK